MTDEEMKRVAEFYNEVSATAEAIKFLKNCSFFRLAQVLKYVNYLTDYNI